MCDLCSTFRVGRGRCTHWTLFHSTTPHLWGMTHLEETRCFTTVNGVTVYLSHVSEMLCSSNSLLCHPLPLSRERKIPFFWSTKVDPLMTLDITAIATPRSGSGAALNPETEAMKPAGYRDLHRPLGLRRKWGSAHAQHHQQPAAPPRFFQSLFFGELHRRILYS